MSIPWTSLWFNDALFQISDCDFDLFSDFDRRYEFGVRDGSLSRRLDLDRSDETRTDYEAWHAEHGGPQMRPWAVLWTAVDGVDAMTETTYLHSWLVHFTLQYYNDDYTRHSAVAIPAKLTYADEYTAQGTTQVKIDAQFSGYFLK